METTKKTRKGESWWSTQIDFLGKITNTSFLTALHVVTTDLKPI